MEQFRVVLFTLSAPMRLFGHRDPLLLHQLRSDAELSAVRSHSNPAAGPNRSSIHQPETPSNDSGQDVERIHTGSEAPTSSLSARPETPSDITGVGGDRIRSGDESSVKSSTPTDLKADLLSPLLGTCL